MMEGPDSTINDLGDNSSSTSATSSAPPAGAAAPDPRAATADKGAGAPTAGAPVPESPAHKILNGILGALGGTENVEYSRDPETGKMIATRTKAGPGQQWKRIIAGALTGAAAGASVKPGPGHLGRAAAAGFQAGNQMVQSDDKQKRDQADEDFEAQQKTTVRKAQVALLNQQVSELTFKNARSKVMSQFEDAVRENAFSEAIQKGGNGSQDLGIARNIDDIIALHKDMPGLLEAQAHGNVLGMPHVNEKGEVDGMHYALVTPEWKGAKLDHDEQFYALKPPTKPGEKPTVATQTVKAGSMTNGDFWTARMAAEKDIMDHYDKQANRDSEEKRTAMTQAAETQRKQMEISADKGGDKAVEKSYNDRNKELTTIETPLQQSIQRMGRLQDTLREGSPQADALVAPELLTNMAGGQGSGLRMNEAEISRIVGGRSHWQDLQASIQRWSTDPASANSITSTQRAQIHSLIQVVSAKLAAKQQVLNQAHEQLASSKDLDEHKQVVIKARKAIESIDAPPEPGMTRIIASDGFMHDVPTAQIESAKKIDPKLRVLY